MLDVRKPRLRPYALEGNFGLEREALRVTNEGRMALTPHPFPPDHIEIRCMDLNPLTGGLVDVRDVAFIHLFMLWCATQERETLSAAIAELAKGNKLNLLIYDGEVLYAHCNFRDTLHVWRDVDAVAFSTRPLSMGTWEPVPFTSLVAAKDGEIVRTSPPHGNEYIYNPEDYRLVYMNFARL